MRGQNVRAGRTVVVWLAASAAFVAASCGEMHPEPSTDEGGLLESPTHEADSLRRTEERQDQNRGGGGGGGSY
jgi:hypothetical protein